MIVDLPSTSSTEVNKRLVTMRQDVGALALSRVLTLVVVVDAEDEAEAAVALAGEASHQHPCRIVTVVTGNRRGAARMDAQIRVGGDAGASEIVLLRLYGPLAGQARSVVIPLLLPDSPVVVWWPGTPPKDPASDPIGQMAQRRITDLARAPRPATAMKQLAQHYSPGDTDLAWSRITRWRGLLATALDRRPFEPVEAAVVAGASDSPSTDLLAGWLQHRLRCPVAIVRSADRSGIVSVRLERRSGNVDLVRPHDGDTATLDQPGQPQRALALAHRSDAESLADELSRLDPDEIYDQALRKGLPQVTRSRSSMADAVRRGDAPSVSASREAAARIAKRSERRGSSAMVEAEPEAASSEPETVHEAAAERLQAKRGED